jgi:septal ring factor EnvC (AmiA/AmiB activator)
MILRNQKEKEMRDLESKLVKRQDELISLQVQNQNLTQELEAINKENFNIRNIDIKDLEL